MHTSKGEFGEQGSHPKLKLTKPTRAVEVHSPVAVYMPNNQQFVLSWAKSVRISDKMYFKSFAMIAFSNETC